MDYYAGLDVSLEETTICVVDETGRIVREARLRLAVEAGNLATWEYDIGRDQGARVGWPEEAILSPGAVGFRFEDWLRQLHPDDRAILETGF